MTGADTVAVLGATGSIGTQTLDVVRADPDRYRVCALGAAASVDELAAQAREFRPDVVALADPAKAAELRSLLPSGIELLVGPDAMAEAALCADTVINGIVGFAGLPVTLATLEAGLRLGLANKESLISAGPVVRRAWATPGAELIPVDSEHCAVHQCLRANENRDRIDKVVLTASGGPFRGRSTDDLQAVTVAEALTHPTWSMGPKITVDSSTLMNKGLEVIEAHELFDVDYDDIDVIVHPQSIVHSMVTFSDGATVAQLSQPDMRLCIGYALAYPDRLQHQYGAIDWSTLERLDFEEPDRVAFGCLDLAFAAGRAGETAPAWLNAANEVAVAAFLAGQVRWVDIAAVISASLDLWPGMTATDVDVVLECDRLAREATRRVIDEKVAV
jgi:1-deoxy-D-xylulose-5-phosphate reductoisomerase